jgi:hypothetical protein
MYNNMDIGKRFGAAFALAAFIACIGLTQVAQAQASSIDGVVSLSYMNITPSPLIAGQNAILSFRIFNSYSSALQDTNIQVSSASAIFNSSLGFATQVGDVGTGEYGGGGPEGYFSYNFHIPSTLQAGEYTIDVVATYETTSSTDASLVLPGQSTIPLYVYVYGVPNLELSGTLAGSVNPGASTVADISVVNSGTDSARNVSMTVLSNPNFTIDGPAQFSLGIIGSGESAAAQLSLQANQSLSAGIRSVPIQLNYTAQSGIKYSVVRMFPINFLVNSPDIVASIESAVPSQLTPGGNQTAQVLIQNIGHGDAKNLSLTFESTPQIKIQSSASTIFIGTLAAGSSIPESVQISATGLANQTSYSIPVALRYDTVAGANTIMALTYMPVSLEGSAAFNITGISSYLLPGSTYQPITITIKNTGNEPAQEISLSLQTVFPITPSNPNAYLNSLGPGQSANVTFFVDVDSHGINGTYPITLYEQWKQPGSGSTQQFSNSNNYFASIGSATGQQSGSSGYGGASTAVVALIIIIAVAYLYRNRLSKAVAPVLVKIRERINAKGGKGHDRKQHY